MRDSTSGQFDGFTELRGRDSERELIVAYVRKQAAAADDVAGVTHHPLKLRYHTVIRDALRQLADNIENRVFGDDS
jgi:hypothetical protein